MVKVYSSGVSDEWFQQEMKTQFQLEQLEGLRSEHTPAAPWLPILLIHIGSQVNKTRQTQTYAFNEFAKIWQTL